MSAGATTKDPIAASPAPWSVTSREVALSVVVALAIVFAHWAAVVAMVRTWNTSPMYSYGFTVPFISGFLLWMRRRELAALAPRPDWFAGTVALILSASMAVAARAGGFQLLDQLAVLVSLTAGVLLLFGRAYVRVAWAALAYLLLMIPLWDGFTESLHEPFQLRSATIGVWILQNLGIPAYREGTFIDLVGIKIEVARACSGVNYLIAVVALGLPLAYVFLQGIWRRVVLLVSAVVVAALANGLRVALIGLLVHLQVGSPLHGPGHVLHGLFVAGIGYVVLFAGLRLLSSGSRSAGDGAPVALPGKTSGEPARVRLSWRHAAVLTLIFIAIGSNVLSRPPQALVLTDSLVAFPDRLGVWEAADSVPRGEGSRLWPNADEEVWRRYRRGDGAVVDLYVAYFELQQQGKEIVNHRTVELHARATSVGVIDPANGKFQVNYVPADDRTPATLFWYHLDAPETNRYVVKARTLLNAMGRSRTNGAVVMLTAVGPQSEKTVEALQQLGGQVEAALGTRLRGARLEPGK